MLWSGLTSFLIKQEVGATGTLGWREEGEVTSLTMEEDWSIRQYYCISSTPGREASTEFSTSPDGQAKVFRRTVQDCTLSLVY